MPHFYEFFAGGGMARAGLSDSWSCLFANDIDPKKAASYTANWGGHHHLLSDVATLSTNDLPGHADLAWASFPCQDLSLAGDQQGLSGKRSGTFWHFWHLIENLDGERRAPGLIVLENVCGAITSHNGKDFAAIGTALAKTGYRFGAMVINANHFVPQSRPRLFIVGIKADAPIDATLRTDSPHPIWHPSNLITAQSKMPANAKASWLWWNLPTPPARTSRFASLIEAEPQGVPWHTPSQTQSLIAMMSGVNLDKLNQAQRIGTLLVGCLYRRTRVNAEGQRVQRSEVRFDDVAGCLRTPGGGSSRQTILIVEGKRVRSRLLSPREAARLMGLPDTYLLPQNYNEAYKLAGDGVVVPVVRFLAQHLLEPLAKPGSKRRKAAA